MRSATLATICLSLLVSLPASGAGAGGKHHRHIKPLTVKIHVDVRPHRRHRADRYSGDVVIVHRARIGTWSYGTSPARAIVTDSQPVLRIIDVASEENGCAMEQGVCVIRP